MSEKAQSILAVLQEFKKSLKKLSGHPIIHKDEYYKEQYLVMLSSVAFAKGSIEKVEMKFLMSLQKAFNLNGEIILYLNKVGNMEKEKIEEFIQFTIKENCKYNFLLDALILISLDGNLNEDKVNIVGEFAEVLDITLEEMEFLCEITTAILEENSKKFNTLLKRTPEKISSGCFRPYVMDFIDVFVIEEDNLDGINELTGSLFINKVIIVSGIFKINEGKIKFGKNGKIVLRTGAELLVQDSEFINAEIVCENLNALNINNCIFKDCENKRPLFIYQCYNEANISNCKFENCILNGENDGGAMLIADSNVEMSNLHFNNCKVEGCGGAICIKESNEFYESIEIKELQFTSCSAKHGGAIYMLGKHNKSIAQYIITESMFNNCKAFEKGGALNILNNEYYKKLVSKCEFNYCEANTAAGAYLNYGNVETSIINCRFDNCKSENTGTAIFYNDFINDQESNSWNVVSNCNDPYNF